MVEPRRDDDISAWPQRVRLLAERDRAAPAQDRYVLRVRVPMQIEMRTRWEAGEVRRPVIVGVQPQLGPRVPVPAGPNSASFQLMTRGSTVDCWADAAAVPAA